MEFYITHSLATYSPKNRKWAEMIEFIKPFEYLIIEDKIGYDALINDIKHKVAELNEKYSKTKPIHFSLNQSCISVSTNIHYDSVFFLHINKVNGFYRFSEKQMKILE